MLKVRIIPTDTEPHPDDREGVDEGLARPSLFLPSPWELLTPYPLPEPDDNTLYDISDGPGDEAAVRVVREGGTRVFLVGAPASAGPETVDILIDSFTAFGDGKHPTTELCVDFLGRHLSSIPREGRGRLAMVDVGTGSGILALMALKMGVGRVDALDLSPDAVRCARGNARLNGCSMRVDLSDVGRYDTGIAYDIVMANLVTDVIIQNIGALSRLLKKEGTMIASGISVGSAEKAGENFANHGFTAVKCAYWRGWTGFQLVRNHSATVRGGL